MDVDIRKELDELKRLTVLAAKKALNLDDASALTGLSKSCLYKKTHKNEIPYYKSNGGKYLYFDRNELNEWMLNVRFKTNDEVEGEAAALLINGKKRKRG